MHDCASCQGCCTEWSAPELRTLRVQPRPLMCRWIVVVAAVAWAAWAAVPFIGGSVPPARRALAVFPLLLLYTSLGWLALVR